jgi:acetate kinase
MNILVLNAGSSSQKSCLYDLETDPTALNPPHPLWEGKIDWSHQQGMAEMMVKSQGEKVRNDLPAPTRQEAVESMLQTLVQGPTAVLERLDQIDVVGHRVVHGGQSYSQPTWVTAAVKSTIAELASLAPAHNPANLEGMETMTSLLPAVPQVAVFDTAFHSHLPLAAAVYPGPYRWFEQGIRRYGFHGISHEYCAQRAAQILGRDLQSLKLITCHLGNGCSLAAVQGGVSIHTTMGFTPLEGLMMGTRSGSVDPGILIHLLREESLTATDLDILLNRQSGLMGISGRSGDMRSILEARAAGDERAQLAFEIYIHRLRCEMGAMLTSLGGLDALVFTGGVGENAAPVREAACASLEFLGMQLDGKQNAQSPADTNIAHAESKVAAIIVRAEEDWAIARACWTLAQQKD